MAVMIPEPKRLFRSGAGAVTSSGNVEGAAFMNEADGENVLFGGLSMGAV